jgi:hypothetical protein
MRLAATTVKVSDNDPHPHILLASWWGIFIALMMAYRAARGRLTATRLLFAAFLGLAVVYGLGHVSLLPWMYTFGNVTVNRLPAPSWCLQAALVGGCIGLAWQIIETLFQPRSYGGGHFVWSYGIAATQGAMFGAGLGEVSKVGWMAVFVHSRRLSEDAVVTWIGSLVGLAGWLVWAWTNRPRRSAE